MTVQREKIKDDLYLAVNEDWLETAEIPADQSSTGGFTTIRNEVEALLMSDLDQMEAGTIELTNDLQREMVKYFRLASDFEQRDQDGWEPLKPYLDKIKKLSSLAELAQAAKEFTVMGYTLPWSLGNMTDFKNAKYYALYLDVPNLLLPDTTYYEEGNETAELLYGAYRQVGTALFALMGVAPEETDTLIDQTFELDRMMAPYQKSSEELADYTLIYNPRAMETVDTYAEDFSFRQVIADVISPNVDRIIVTQPEFYRHYSEIFSDEHLDLIKSWMIFKFVIGHGGLLSEEIRQLTSQIDQALTGTTEAPSQDKAAFRLVNSQFSHVLGDYYGKKYFGEKARADIREMVEEMISVYKDRLAQNQWLSDETANKAIEKLDYMEILVGYPDEIQPVFNRLKVDESKSFFDNHKQISAEHIADNLDKWNEKVDRQEWGMSASTVNAYFSPTANLICFPAAILQKPFYDFEQSRSANYGGIGAVIAHEISHAFDNNGAKVDKFGNIDNWWTDADFKAFDGKAEEMVEQWDGIPYADGKVNGRLTVSENIADLGGLTAALEALKHEEDADLEEFFFNWARIWAQKARPEIMNLLLSVDVHSPSPLRANIPAQNLTEFYDTFKVQAGDKMYRAPENRIQIW